MGVKVQVKGVHKLDVRLNRLDRFTESRPVVNAGKYIRTELRKYPPKPSRSRYRRTYRLRRGWKVRQHRDKRQARITVTNGTPYGPYVMGVGIQSAAMKRIGWRTDVQAARKGIEKFLREADKWLKNST